MKTLKEICALCDHVNRAELSRLASVNKIPSVSNFNGRAVYTDEAAERLIAAYWTRRRITVAQRTALRDDTILR